MFIETGILMKIQAFKKKYISTVDCISVTHNAESGYRKRLVWCTTVVVSRDVGLFCISCFLMVRIINKSHYANLFEFR